MITDSTRRQGRPGTGARKALVLGVAGVVAATGVATMSGTASAQSTLGSAAAASGRYFGAAVAANRLSEGDYVSTLNREFNSITAENEMKWNTTEPNRGQFNFGPGDQIADHARSQGMELRGHTLVWHSQLPGWVGGLQGNDLRNAMNSHITGMMQHYQGQISAWDVVNEAFADGGGGGRRNSVFQQQLGDGYIEEAFRTADSVDPNVTLCYNDYNIGTINAKSNAVYNMAQDFVSRGVPIDCVGIQGHFNSGNPVNSTVAQNVQRFAALGLEVQFTELDIAGGGSQQANDYRTVVDACMATSQCGGITVWGVTDKYSWRSQDTPLLFDGNYNKKPAYDATLQALGGSGGNPGDPGDPGDPNAGCTATYSPGQEWGDRFNGEVTVTAGDSGTGSWTVTVTVTPPQKISATWNGNPTWDTSGNVMTMRPNGNGTLGAGQSTSFGFTVMANGEWSTPVVGSCVAS